MVTSTKMRGPSPHARSWTQRCKLYYFFFILSTLIGSVAFSQVDFRQSANNDAGYTQGDVHWLNSILQQSNSTYVEGMSSLQRIILLNVAPKSSHTITFSHQSIKSSASAHAYDFITSWAQAKAVSNLIGTTSFNPALTLYGNLNECGAEPGSDPTGYLTACQTAHSSNGGTNYFDAILDDNMADGSLGGSVKDRIAAYEALAKSISADLEQRSIRVWGNAPVINATVTFTGYTGGDQDANYSLTWESTATTIVIEFATHLAVGRDPFKTSTHDIGYGASKGAGQIPGGPYHVNLYQLDGASLGSQDNQIKAADVLIPPSCTVSGPTIICAEDGQKTYNSLVTDGGSSPTYSWSFVPTPNTVNAEFYNNTNLTANAVIQPVGGPATGDYLPGTFSLSMTVTTAEGLSATCALPSAVTVYKVTVSETHTSIACYGGTSTATITATGGTAPYSYTLNGVTNNTGVFANLPAGSYTASVTDANGCGGSVAVNITQPPQLTCTIPENAPVLCYGESNGTATVAAIGGTAPYTYLWDNGETTQKATVLNAGTHSVTVTDANGCTTSCEISISQPTAVSLSATAGEVACNGGTATITVTGSGGTPPYTYSLDGVTYGSSNTFTRGAGDYTAYVKDANGCIASAPVSVTQPSTLEADVEATPILCYGDNTTITVSATGGTPPYTYSLDGVTYGATNTFTRGAGSYTGYVKDANGCIDSEPITVTQPTQLVAGIEATPILCYGDNTTITVSATGGTAPYTYSLDGITYGSTNTFTRTAGSYTGYVKDANGCIDNAPITVNQPTQLVASASAGSVECNGGTTTITVSATGGTAPYTYSLDGITYSGTNTFTRGAGSYTAYVKDANGCIDSEPVTVNQPSTVDVTAASTPILCYGGNSTITLTGSGGTPPYTYSLDGVTYGSSNTFTRTAGSYTGYVKDANGCIDNTPITIEQPSAVVAGASSTPILCYGGNTTITVTGSGGTPPYTYSLDGVTYGGTNTFTRTAGSYTAYVKDANGCIDSEPITVNQPTQLVAGIEATPILCYGGTTTITVSATGGTAPYTYSLDGVTYGSSNTFTRTAGSYTGYVKDANGCIDSEPITVNQPTAVEASALAGSVDCNGGTATITVTGSGGTPPYTYSLDGVTYGSSNTFTRGAGDYTAYVKDANGCIDDAPVTVSQPTTLEADIEATPILCYGDNTTITLTATGGTPPYTYSLDGVTYSGTNTFTRGAGSYTGYVKDANGCIDSEPITVTQPTELVASIEATPIPCYGDNTTITVSATGGTAPYTYSLDGITYGSTNTFTRTAGSYTGYVKDANGCIDNAPITVNQPTLLTCTATLVKAADCGQTNGSATVTPSGGTSPYTYLWDNGETTATATALAPGTHTVTVTDYNQCTTTCEVVVPELPCGITLCTYTQGAYGNAGGKYCTPQGQKTTYQLIQYALGNWGGLLYIGRPGHSLAIHLNGGHSDVQAVIDILPGGGPSKVLDQSADASSVPSSWLKNGRLNNTLLAQTITMGLNMGITTELGNLELRTDRILVTAKPAYGCKTSSADIVPCSYKSNYLGGSAVIQYLYNNMWNGTAFVADGSNNKKATVYELFQLASAALGKVNLPMGITLESIAGVEDRINNIFDGCRVFVGYMTQEQYDALVAPCFSTVSSQSAERLSGSDLKIAAYPNPYNNTVSFNFTSPVSGKATLEVYDLVGRRLAVVFEGSVDAGMQKNVNYNVPSAQRVPMIYRLTIGSRTSFGKLMPGTTD